MRAAGTTTAPTGRDDYLPAFRWRVLVRHYDPIARLTIRATRCKQRLLDLARIEDGMDVLDVGCGTGTLMILAKRRAPLARVRGVDRDPQVLAMARANAARAGLELAFEEGPATRLPYPDASFDRVLCSLMFHHLTRDEKRAAAREFARVLRPGGELHIVDFGPPRDPLMRVLSLLPRLGDGFERTADNFTGRVPGLIAQSDLSDVRLRAELRTPSGPLAFHSARRPGAAPAPA